MGTERKRKAFSFLNLLFDEIAVLGGEGRIFMNCLCNIFDNNNVIWLLIIVFLLISCCGNGCGTGYASGNGCGCGDFHGNGCGC